MIILYASDSNESQQMALLIQNKLLNNSNILDNRISCNSTLEISRFEFIKILDIDTIIFVCSTTDNGTEPTPMSDFWKQLTNKNLPNGCLSHLSFAVFGLGDSSTNTYNWCSKKLFNCLIKLGATPILRRGCSDIQDKKGYLTEFEDWMKDFNKLLKHKKLSDAFIYCAPEEICKSFTKHEFLRTKEFLKYNEIDIIYLNTIIEYDFDCIPLPTFFLDLYNFINNVPEYIKDKVLQIYNDYDLYNDYVTADKRSIFKILVDLRIKINIEFILKNIPKKIHTKKIKN